MGLVQLAERYCLHYHKHQRRKGGNRAPYASHPFAARDILVAHAYDEDLTQVIALLHDTIEDTEIAKNKREIQRRFGDFVYEGVYVLSNNTIGKHAAITGALLANQGITLIGEDGKLTSEAYKARLLLHPDTFKVVKIADMIHNTSSLPDLDKTGIARKLHDADDFYIPLGRAVAPIMVQDLEANIADYKTSAHFQQTFPDGRF